LEDRRKDGGTNFILRIKEQGTRLTLQEQGDDNDDDDDDDDDTENNVSYTVDELNINVRTRLLHVSAVNCTSNCNVALLPSTRR